MPFIKAQGAVCDSGSVVPLYKLGTHTQVAAGAVATTSAVIGATAVMLCSSVFCHVAIGSAPTAATGDILLGPGVDRYIIINATDKISVVKASGAADGVLSIVALATS